AIRRTSRCSAASSERRTSGTAPSRPLSKCYRQASPAAFVSITDAVGSSTERLSSLGRRAARMRPPAPLFSEDHIMSTEFWTVDNYGPFNTRADAEAFAKRNGAEIAHLCDVRLVSSMEMTREEYARWALDHKHEILIDPEAV